MEPQSLDHHLIFSRLTGRAFSISDVCVLVRLYRPGSADADTGTLASSMLDHWTLQGWVESIDARGPVAISEQGSYSGAPVTNWVGKVVRLTNLGQLEAAKSQPPPSDLLNRRRYRRVGAILGLILGVVLAAIFRLGDPYYANSQTARQVFWFGIVPFFLLFGSACGGLLGAIVLWVEMRQRRDGS